MNTRGVQQLRWVLAIGATATLFCQFALAEDPLQLAWSRQLGTTSRDTCTSTAVDGFGNVYLSGHTMGNLNGEVSSGGNDLFLMKCDAMGNIVWTRQIPMPRGSEGKSVSVDAAGNVYLCGDIGTVGENAFLAKYDSSGNMLWMREFGTTSKQSGHSVAVDTNGNAYVSGVTGGDLGGAA